MREKQYEWLLFDLDGTITDSAEGIFNCFRYGLGAVGLEEPDSERLRAILGPPLLDAYRDMYGLTDEQAKMALAKYRERYSVTGLFENRVYDGAEQMLSRCREAGYKIALATAKPEAYAGRIIEHFGLTKYFDLVTGASLDTSRHTKSAVISHIFETMGITDKSRVLMIGDRKDDLLGARNCGVDGLGVLYGYGSYEELSACPHVHLAKTPEGVADFLRA